jgi:hypothetical protein
VDFCQAHIFLKTSALSSPLIESRQATGIFPLHSKAVLPPLLIAIDASNLGKQKHLETLKTFQQRQ